MNTIAWGFCKKNGHAIINELKKSLTIKHWISDAPEANSIRGYLSNNISTYQPEGKSVEKFEQFYSHNFFTFQIMATRRGLHYPDVHTLTNEFSMLFYHFDNMLENANIDLVIFSNIPHEGPDFVLYKVAKLHGIKTLLCFQSIFCNRFFITTSMDDFGQFSSAPSIFAEETIHIEEGHKQDLFYMTSALKQAEAYNSRKSFKKVRSDYDLCKQLLEFLIEKLRDSTQGTYNITRIKIFSLLRALKKQHRYIRALSEAVTERTRLNEILDGKKNIAYFPLHLQPELTTSALGDIYQDQLYAIELLANLLDEDWVIVVKENPKQKFFQRDDLFFKRLDNIPRTYLADPHFPSISIIRKSSLTATITGTAGWEAIKGGGKCLVFGQAWFSTLKNCLAYSQQTDHNTLMQFLSESCTFSEFRQSFDKLSHKMGVGIVDSYYVKQLPSYTPESNAAAVTASLMRVISCPETAWS